MTEDLHDYEFINKHTSEQPQRGLQTYTRGEKGVRGIFKSVISPKV